MRKIFFSIKIALLLVLGQMLLAGGAFAEPPSMEEVKKELSEARAAIRAYSEHRQAEAVKAMEGSLENMDREIAILGEKMKQEWEKMEPDARQKAQESLDQLRRLRDRMAKSIDEWKSGGAITWNKIKEDFLKTWEEYRRSFEDADRQYDRPTVNI
jgi:hypothetical protein